MKPTGDPYLFTAPDFAYFMDSPIELSNFELREWEVSDRDGKKQTIRLSVHHDDEPQVVDNYAEMVKKVVVEQQAIFGELPDFEYDTYTFICDYRVGNEGDGMEHRNSTICTAGFQLKDHEHYVIGTISHEFFHAWNVERIRPASIEPFDFTTVNMCPELWFGEGFTSYYGELTLCRAGIIDREAFGKRLERWLNYVLQRPGTGSYSPVEMSKMAPFVDAATANDPIYYANTFTSYYAFGAIVALALDLEIRNRFPHHSLDDFMRECWKMYGINEVPFYNDDLKRILAEVCNDKAFAEVFFNKYVYGTEIPVFIEM